MKKLLKSVKKCAKCAKCTIQKETPDYLIGVSPQGITMSDNSQKELLSEFTKRLYAYTNRRRISTTSSNETAMIPLLDRVKKLLDTIPLADQQQGLALTELQMRLRGRKGKRCHPGELAECLRQLKFSRSRSWKEGRTGFCSRWVKS